MQFLHSSGFSRENDPASGDLQNNHGWRDRKPWLFSRNLSALALNACLGVSPKIWGPSCGIMENRMQCGWTQRDLPARSEVSCSCWPYTCLWAIPRELPQGCSQEVRPTPYRRSACYHKMKFPCEDEPCTHYGRTMHASEVKHYVVRIHARRSSCYLKDLLDHRAEIITNSFFSFASWGNLQKKTAAKGVLFLRMVWKGLGTIHVAFHRMLMTEVHKIVTAFVWAC
jgi:hypothetical protein